MPSRVRDLLRSDSARRLVARAGRRLREFGLPLPPPARLVYHPDYISFPTDAGARATFDVRRPARILEELRRRRLVARDQVLCPELARREDLLRVHPAHFLDEIGRPEKLAELLFVQPDPLFMIDSPLEPFLAQTGGTILAAERALADGLPIFNLGGGFHHAQRDRAEGFCPVNDVAIAIRRVQELGLASRVLVFDLDFHHGNGTALIFSEDERVFTASVHGQTWAHVEGKAHNLDRELPPGTTDEPYLEAVRDALATALGRFRPELVIYLAGADPYCEDKLGDFAISEEGMLRRDLHVFETVTGAGLPLAVVLAGGYGPLAWTIPYNFIHSVLTGGPLPSAARPGNLAARADRVAQRLDVVRLRQGESRLGPEDLADFSAEQRGGPLFLGFYTEEGLAWGLREYGFLQLLEDRGFAPLLVSVDTKDPLRHIARIHYAERDPEHLVVELVARLRTTGPPTTPSTLTSLTEPKPAEPLRLLSIEWLLMQDPRASFSLDRPKLPGQQYPGLGLGRWIVELLRKTAERLECDGLMNQPAHYHTALLYSRYMLFLDPEEQGRFEALKRDLAHLPLLEATERVAAGQVLDASTGQVLHWEAGPQVLPLAPRLIAHFARAEYQAAVQAARGRSRYGLLDRGGGA
ncbi:MAG: histone deacetylase [Deltaproteobacteria bacterium]|nr:histone deacetylase [Deltaproteobacteria bacterium]